MAEEEAGPWRKLFRAIPGATQTIQSGWSLVEQLGLKPWLVTGVLGGAYAAAAWFWHHVPWYVAGLLFLGVLWLCLLIYHRWLLIRSTRKWSPRKYREVGKRMVDLSEEAWRFLAERERDKAQMHRQEKLLSVEALNEIWQADRDFDRITSRQFHERFGARVLGSLALLRQLGAEIPYAIIPSASDNPEKIPTFLATIGDLMAAGHITDAIDISKDKDFIFQLR